MKKFIYLVIFSLYLMASVAVGQTPFFQQYFLLKKNEPIQVNKVFQDHTGFIWFGTNKGLFRFDGLNYRRFDKADTAVDNNITALAEDTLGRIWLGHQNGQLSYLENGRLNRFETREGAATEPVSDILFDRKGTLWFSTLNDGLYYYIGKRLYRVDDQEGLPDLFIYDLFEDPEGKIWAGTDGGIAICSLNNRKIHIQVLNTDDGLSDIIIKKIQLLTPDTISFATEDGGIFNLNIKTQAIKPLIEQTWTYGSISDFVFKEDQVWISSPRKGIVVYDRHTKAAKLFNKYEGQSLLSVNDLMSDAEGNIWLGSKVGVRRTLGDAVEHIDLLDPVRDLNIVALAVDSKNGIWFSNSEGLFLKTYDDNGESLIEKKLGSSAFKNASIISLYVDTEGYVWAGFYGNGLLRINPVTGQLKHFYKELRNGNILSITGKGNTVWLATLGGSTSITVDNGKYAITNYGSADGLSSDFVYQVFIDSKERIWFATDGKGVSMRDGNGFHHFEEGLGSKVVYSFAEDINKNIWASSQDNGIYRFDGKKFEVVPEIRLRDNTIQSLSADQLGNIMMMHNFGIDVYDVNRKQMRYWGEESGIHDKFPNLNALAKNVDGGMYIGTSKGIVKFSLSNDHVIASPRPAIDAIRIYDDFIDISKPLQLDYNENNVTINYLGFWYQNSENLNYLYTLENYDIDWIGTRNQNVTYSRLPPGDYVFKVKVSETENFTNAFESSLAFSITPPFWRTGAFYIFIAGLLLISGYSVIKFRERKLLEDKMILEGKVEERTLEIQRNTEEIQAQNEEIMAQAEEIQGINENLEMLVKERTAELEKKNKALEEYAFINAHKLRSPVASILGLLNLLKKMELIEEASIIRDHLQKSAVKLDEVVRSITKAIERADNEYF